MNFANTFKYITLGPLALADFTDGEDATGYVDGEFTLPAGAIPVLWEADVTTAFAGTTSATMMVGTTTDTDAFSATTSNSVAAVAKKTSFALAPSSTSARTIRVTVTDTKASSPDFGDFTAGELTLRLFYHLPQ